MVITTALSHKVIAPGAEVRLAITLTNEGNVPRTFVVSGPWFDYTVSIRDTADRRSVIHGESKARTAHGWVTLGLGKSYSQEYGIEGSYFAKEGSYTIIVSRKIERADRKAFEVITAKPMILTVKKPAAPPDDAAPPKAPEAKD